MNLHGRETYLKNCMGFKTVYKHQPRTFDVAITAAVEWVAMVQFKSVEGFGQLYTQKFLGEQV